jgi:hypothetical protein
MCVGYEWLETTTRTVQDVMSRDSVFGVETHYGLDSPGIESRWG